MLARVDVDPLLKEQQRIDARRQRNEERRQRILDERSRTIGVNVSALEQQISERRAREEQERLEKLKDDLVRTQHAQILQDLERERLANARKAELELNAFREAQALEAAQRRRQEAVKYPAISTGDSIVLAFSGEDVDHATRQKAQQLQLQDWLNEQLAEQREKERKEREEEEAYVQQQRAIQLKLQELEQLQRAEKAKQLKELQMAHLTQAEEARIRREYEAERDRRAAEREIQAQMNSALLNELQQARRDNAARPVPSQFKGFSLSQREFILAEQEAQRRELALRRQQQEEEEKAWAQKLEDDRRKLIALQREADANRARELASLAETRARQAAEIARREKFLKENVYKGEVTEEFFNRFGTDCR